MSRYAAIIGCQHVAIIFSSDANMLNHRKSRAFTITEIIVVVTIIAISAHIVLSRIGNNSASQLVSAASVVVSDLAYVQAESMAHGDDPRVLVINSTNNGYFVAAKSAPTVPLTNPLTKQPYSVTFGTSDSRNLAAVTISAYSLGGDKIIGFDVYGALDQATNATITLAAGTRTILLTIDPNTGDVTVGNVN